MEFNIDKIAGETGKRLKSQPKVSIIIPKKPGFEYWEGGINGYFITVPCEVQVEVPQSIANLIQRSATVLVNSQKETKEFTSERGKKVG